MGPAEGLPNTLYTVEPSEPTNALPLLRSARSTVRLVTSRSRTREAPEGLNYAWMGRQSASFRVEMPFLATDRSPHTPAKSGDRKEPPAETMDQFPPLLALFGPISWL